ESSGRTLLLCYRPIDNPVRASAGPIAPAGAADTQSLSRILAELSALPLFANGGDRHVSWTAYPTPLDSHGPGHRYAVRVAHPESGSIETRVVAGRLHVAEDQARADFTSAVQLLGAGFAKRMRIPRPLARLVSEPCLVLYDFDPW